MKTIDEYINSFVAVVCSANCFRCCVTAFVFGRPWKIDWYHCQEEYHHENKKFHLKKLLVQQPWFQTQITIFCSYPVDKSVIIHSKELKYNGVGYADGETLSDRPTNYGYLCLSIQFVTPIRRMLSAKTTATLFGQIFCKFTRQHCAECGLLQPLSFGQY